jgi:protein required for attachment to host cells
MKNWLLVANAARARVLEVTDKLGVYVHVADLVHPQSRQKGQELGWDRPGQVMGASHGLGGASFTPRTSPREREHEHFAREVAAVLDQGVAAGRCAGIVLVASNPFLGEVRSHLGEQAGKAVLRVVPSDYTALRDSEIADRLAMPAEGS